MERQVQTIFERVGKPLRMSKKECRRQLPLEFPERLPSDDQLGLTIPLLVPRLEGITWLQVVEAAGLRISDYLKSVIGKLGEWPDPRGIVIPSKPYGTWVQDGTRYVNRRPMDVREELESGERGGTHWDGVGLAILRPDMVKSGSWDLIGSEVDSGHLPCLRWWGARPGFASIGPTLPILPRSRALVCGSQTEA